MKERNKTMVLGLALFAIGAAVLIGILLADFSIKTITGVAIAALVVVWFKKKQDAKWDKISQEEKNPKNE